jgi:hypothetical protein
MPFRAQPPQERPVRGAAVKEHVLAVVHLSPGLLVYKGKRAAAKIGAALHQRNAPSGIHQRKGSRESRKPAADYDAAAR